MKSSAHGGNADRSAGLYSISTEAQLNILFLLSILILASSLEWTQNRSFNCDLLCTTKF
ncbi:MAG: hypothetical protein WCG25_09880 [bacterium]